jgi:hypothetical protein
VDGVGRREDASAMERPGRRRAADLVVVPNLVGLTVAAARDVATAAGVVPASADPDGPPLAARTWPGRFVVTGQDPAPGAVLFRWDSVVVEVRPDDGRAGDRVPRTPPPARLEARAEADRPLP